MFDFLSAAILSALGSSNPTPAILDTLLSNAKQKSEPAAHDSSAASDPNMDELLAQIEKRSKFFRELSISHRIDTAEKVSIEEYYDTKSTAGVKPLKQSGQNYDIDVPAEHVVKRVYTFEGCRESGLDELRAMLPSSSPDLAELLSKLLAGVADKTGDAKKPRRSDAGSAS